MKPWVHLLLSLILAVILYPIFNFGVIFIFIGGVLIDVDHYLWYVYKYKKFNLFDSYKFYNIKNTKEHLGILLIFHTIEFLAAMIFLSFYFKSILIFTIGLLPHYLLDLIYFYKVYKRLIVNHSILSWIIKNKIKKV